jgi:hypothetical protein
MHHTLSFLSAVKENALPTLSCVTKNLCHVTSRHDVTRYYITPTSFHNTKYLGPKAISMELLDVREIWWQVLTWGFGAS